MNNNNNNNTHNNYQQYLNDAEIDALCLSPDSSPLVYDTPVSSRPSSPTPPYTYPDPTISDEEEEDEELESGGGDYEYLTDLTFDKFQPIKTEDSFVQREGDYGGNKWSFAPTFKIHSGEFDVYRFFFQTKVGDQCVVFCGGPNPIRPLQGCIDCVVVYVADVSYTMGINPLLRFAILKSVRSFASVFGDDPKHFFYHICVQQVNPTYSKWAVIDQGDETGYSQHHHIFWWKK